MTVWAVASLRGSPGATTLAMGLGAAWPVAAGRSRLVMEADPDGGVLAARFDELRADRTVADAAAALRRQFDLEGLMASTRTVWGGVPVVPASPSAEQTTAVLANAAERMAIGLASAAEVDVIVDVGRLTARSVALPLARRAVVTLLVSRTRFEDVAALTARAGELRAAGVEPLLVAIGLRPYSPTEVAAESGLALLAALPHDPASAAVLAGEGRADGRLRRSLLWRSMCELASRLLPLAATPVAALDESGKNVTPLEPHEEVPAT